MHTPPFTVRTLFIAPLLALSLPSQTTTAVPCTRDNTLYESSTGSFSNAIGESLFVGVTALGLKRRALLRFDLAAALPAGAVVLQATLQMNVLFSGAPQSTTMTAHALTQAFGEGTSYAIAGGGGMGAPTTVGDATWTQAIHPNQAWASVGGDFAASPVGSIELPVGGICSGTLDAAVVQSWLVQPAQNQGILLKTAEQLPLDRARRLDSRENPTGQPQLLVTWLAPGQTATWGQGCPVGGGVLTSAFLGAPLGGTSIAITHANATANSIGANFFALSLDPLGTQLAPACRTWLPLAGPLFPGDIFVTDAAGTAASAFALPAGFPGRLISSQAAVLDGSALGFALGNANVLVLQ